jgi:site-specific recombinase XerD
MGVYLGLSSIACSKVSEYRNLLARALYGTHVPANRGARINKCSSIILDEVEDDGVKIIGKNQMKGKLYLPPSAKKVLDGYLKVRRSRGTNRVFTNRDGMLMSYDGLRQEIYQISGKARIKFSEHRARRFCARFRDESGLDPEDIRLMMRHEKFDTTKSI